MTSFNLTASVKTPPLNSHTLNSRGSEPQHLKGGAHFSHHRMGVRLASSSHAQEPADCHWLTDPDFTGKKTETISQGQGGQLDLLSRKRKCPFIE
jgi:hypothetical protein